jgi:hypothetical protein
MSTQFTFRRSKVIKRSESEKFILGTFEVKGSLLIGDPCYDSSDLIPVPLPVQGDWAAEVRKKGGRCAKLYCYAQGKKSAPASRTEEREVSVDSGQAGVFVESTFKDDSLVGLQTFIPEEPWYSHVCDVTCNSIGAGIVNTGAASSSGWGDGGHRAMFYFNNANEVYKIVINFCV